MRIPTRTDVYDLEQWLPLEVEMYSYDGPLLLQDRSAQAAAKANEKAATNAGTTATNTAGGYGSGAAGIGGTLVPALTQEATHPQGFNPTDINNMLVSGEQGAGGANSGITGEAALHGMRTRNAGGFTGALDQAARIKGQQLSGNALNVQNENANLKQKQQQAGLAGLQGMYGTDVSAQLKAMGLVPEDINAGTNATNAEVNAGKSGWLQNVEGIADTASNAYKAYKGNS